MAGTPKPGKVPSDYAYSSAQSGGYFTDNLVTVARYMMAHGYKRAAAAGMAGAIAGESSGDPEAQSSSAAGLIQWTPPSKATPNQPVVSGDPAVDFANQLPDILAYNQAQGKSAIASLNAAADPVSAADTYSQLFERPAATDSDVRPDVAQQVYDTLSGQKTTGSTSTSPYSNVKWYEPWTYFNIPSDAGQATAKSALSDVAGFFIDYGAIGLAVLAGTGLIILGAVRATGHHAAPAAVPVPVPVPA